jgi:hypothetical protein
MTFTLIKNVAPLLITSVSLVNPQQGGDNKGSKQYIS